MIMDRKSAVVTQRSIIKREIVVQTDSYATDWQILCNREETWRQLGNRVATVVHEEPSVVLKRDRKSTVVTHGVTLRGS